MEKRESSCTVGGKANWYSHYSFKQLGIKLPCDTAIPLLGINLEKTVIQKDTCAPTFTAALFTRARTWKPPQCPLTYKKLWHLYTTECYSAIKRRKSESAEVRWMKLKLVIQGEVKKRKISYINTYIWNLEKRYWQTYLQDRSRDTDVENRLWSSWGGGGGYGLREQHWRINSATCEPAEREAAVQHGHLSWVLWGGLGVGWGGDQREAQEAGDICTLIAESCCRTAETNTTL